MIRWPCFVKCKSQLTIKNGWNLHPRKKELHCGDVLTLISALGSRPLTVPKAACQELWLFLLAHRVSKLSHLRDLQQNTGNLMRCCVLFQTFCLTISSQVQGGAAAGTEEVGKVWLQVNRQSDPSTLRGHRAGDLSGV